MHTIMKAENYHLPIYTEIAYLIQTIIITIGIPCHPYYLLDISPEILSCPSNNQMYLVR